MRIIHLEAVLWAKVTHNARVALRRELVGEARRADTLRALGGFAACERWWRRTVLRERREAWRKRAVAKVDWESAVRAAAGVSTARKSREGARGDTPCPAAEAGGETPGGTDADGGAESDPPCPPPDTYADGSVRLGVSREAASAQAERRWEARRESLVDRGAGTQAQAGAGARGPLRIGEGLAVRLAPVPTGARRAEGAVRLDMERMGSGWMRRRKCRYFAPPTHVHLARVVPEVWVDPRELGWTPEATADESDGGGEVGGARAEGEEPGGGVPWNRWEEDRWERQRCRGDPA